MYWLGLQSEWGKLECGPVGWFQKRNLPQFPTCPSCSESREQPFNNWPKLFVWTQQKERTLPWKQYLQKIDKTWPDFHLIQESDTSARAEKNSCFWEYRFSVWRPKNSNITGKRLWLELDIIWVLCDLWKN